jgi:hypothetical protein
MQWRPAKQYSFNLIISFRLLSHTLLYTLSYLIMASSIDNNISFQDRKLEVQRMPQRLTPAQLVGMPRKDRDAVYMQWLDSPKTVDFPEEDVPDFEKFDFPLLPGDGLLRKQIAREARRVYYMHNTFAVLSHTLSKFLANRGESGVSVPVKDLVRKILVKVDLEHMYDAGTVAAPSKSLDEEDEPWAALDLQHLYMRPTRL